jgi:PIF1-like helicase
MSPETAVTYLYSEDSITDDDPNNPLLDAEGAAEAERHKARITVEMLHAETPSGMPHHELRLKVDAIVMLVRNLDVSAGLVNGLRLKVVSVSRLLVRARAISGGANIKGQVIDFTRIDFEGDLEATVRMKRTQFPLRLAFAITINKSQGMTLKKVSLSISVTGRFICLLLGGNLSRSPPQRSRQAVYGRVATNKRGRDQNDHS